MEIKIRKVKTEDLENVLKLALRTPELHTQKGKPDYYSLDQLNGFIKNRNAIFIGAFVNEQLAGFRLATYDPYAKEAYLINLVVDKAYEHKGIGQILYKKTFEILKKKGCRWSWVLVHEHNTRMQSFLTKQEFERGPKFVYFRKRFSK